MTPQRSPIVWVNNAATAGVPSILPVIRFTRWSAATLLTLTWKMYELNAPYKGLIKPPLITRRVYNHIKTTARSRTRVMINSRITAHFDNRHRQKNILKEIIIFFSLKQGNVGNKTGVRHNLRSSCYAALKTHCWIVSSWAIYVIPHRNIPSINFGQINGKEKNIKAAWSAGRGGQEGRITRFADN